MFWKKEKKGLAPIVALMIVILFFFVGFALAGPTQEVIGMAQDDQDCDNSSISDTKKDACTIMGLNSPLFIATIYAIAASIIVLIGGVTRPPKRDKRPNIFTNKKGAAILSLVLSISMFIAGALFIDDIQQEVDNTKSDLSCSQTNSISDSNKFTCLITSSIVPYFIWGLLSITIGAAIGRAL